MGDGLASATKFLVLALTTLYVIASVAGIVLINFDTTRDTILWMVFLALGAALMLVGQLRVPLGTRYAVVVSIGAVLGGLPLFWTILVPIAVAVVIACSFKLARQTSTPA